VGGGVAVRGAPQAEARALPDLAALRPDVPAFLLRAIEGALAKDPAHRWRDGGEFLER
jgi:hypothetical protein